MWKIILRAGTAETGGFEVKFLPQPTKTFGADCFRDPAGIVWRGKVTPGSAAIQNEALRMRMLHEAADLYGKALRKAINPFPEND